jgi:hypothetical protein
MDKLRVSLHCIKPGNFHKRKRILDSEIIKPLIDTIVQIYPLAIILTYLFLKNKRR